MLDPGRVPARRARRLKAAQARSSRRQSAPGTASNGRSSRVHKRRKAVPRACAPQSTSEMLGARRAHARPRTQRGEDCPMTDVNRRLLLSKPPQRAASRSTNFTVDEAAVPEPGEGEALVKTLYISLDPTNRVWMVADSYLPKVEEGAVMRGLGLGQVIASNDERYPVGDLVVGTLGWQEYVTTGETRPAQRAAARHRTAADDDAGHARDDRDDRLLGRHRHPRGRGGRDVRRRRRRRGGRLGRGPGRKGARRTGRRDRRHRGEVRVADLRARLRRRRLLPRRRLAPSSSPRRLPTASTRSSRTSAARS